MSQPVAPSLIRVVTGHIGDTRACGTGDSQLALAHMWPMFERGVRFRAQRMTDDLDMREDLIQEAMISLWRADPTRFNVLRPRARGYLRRMLRNRMVDVLRAEESRQADVSFS